MDGAKFLNGSIQNGITYSFAVRASCADGFTPRRHSAEVLLSALFVEDSGVLPLELPVVLSPASPVQSVSFS